MENKDTKNRVLPLYSFILINALNSLWRVKINLIHNIFIRDGINQYMGGIMNRPKNTLNQFKDKLKFVAGSKVEKRFAITFKR